jgi:hypothetical protein
MGPQLSFTPPIGRGIGFQETPKQGFGFGAAPGEGSGLSRDLDPSLDLQLDDAAHRQEQIEPSLWEERCSVSPAPPLSTKSP